MSRKIEARFRDSDDWIIDEIERTITMKRQMGIDTSLGFELARLLRKAIVNDFEQQKERAEALGFVELWKDTKNESR